MGGFTNDLVRPMERYNSYKDSGVQWLGEIPSHWEMKRWRFLMLENTTKNSNCKERLQLQFRYGDIVRKANQSEESDVLDTISKYTVVEPDDIMINGLNLNYDFVSQRVAQVQERGVITSAYISLRPTKIANSRYFTYFLKSMDAKKMFHGMGTGIRLTLSYNELKNQFIPCPSPEEQSAIATYLDAATAKIDAAIAQQQKMIDLLNERKQIIINRAVTKGLNPDAKMKDSGVEWIGEVPEDWEIIKAKYIWNEYSEKTKTGNEQLLSVSQYGGVVPNNTESRSESFVGYKMVHKDILVINIMLAWMGGFDVSQIEGIVSPAYCTYRCDKKNALSKFLGYLYKSNMYLAEFARRSTGIIPSRWRMYTDDFGQVLTILPPIQSQKEIVEYIDTEIGKIIPYINKCQKQISLLQERKQIIINEVVTGKVRVV